jgi:Squalene-hopene cyclase C-terminal domain
MQDRRRLWLVAAFASASVLGVRAHPALAVIIRDGVACLNARQVPVGSPAAGSWGDPNGSAYRDTTVAADAFATVDELGAGFQQAQSFLTSGPQNQDYLARQILTFAAGGQDPTTAIAALLSGQAAEISNPAVSGYPGGGWGVAPGFEPDLLTTALALRALVAAGVSRGTAVARAVVPTGGQNVHQVTLPAGATNLVILVRGVTGTVRLFIDTPTAGTFFLDLTNVTAPTNLTGLPVQAGTYGLRVASLSGGPNTYSFEARFADATGFDVGRITRALSYLALAQNGDGSWGFRGGDAGSLAATSEVVRALAAVGGNFAPRKVLTDAASWLQTHQNPDGGAGSETGVGTVYETALLGLSLYAVDPAAAGLTPAKNYLVARQQPNGCWNDDSYSTGMALQFLGPLFLCRLDVDRNGAADVPTDLVYVPRRLLGLTTVPSSFRTFDPTIPTNAYINEKIATLGSRLDVDMNGSVDVATDVVYVIRRRLGLTPVPPSFRVLDPTIPSNASIATKIDALCVN